MKGGLNHPAMHSPSSQIIVAVRYNYEKGHAEQQGEAASYSQEWTLQRKGRFTIARLSERIADTAVLSCSKTSSKARYRKINAGMRHHVVDCVYNADVDGKQQVCLDATCFDTIS